LGKSILFTGKPLTFLQFVVEYRRYAKTMRKPSKVAAFQREGIGASPQHVLCEPLPALPGMTGTGAPVTEQLRCPFSDKLGWYRESIFLAPKIRGGVYFLYLFMEVESK
jgi:hypothetical protein